MFLKWDNFAMGKRIATLLIVIQSESSENLALKSISMHIIKLMFLNKA